MNMDNRLSSTVAPAEVIFPASEHEARKYLNRWSNTGVGKPFAIVIPSNEDEIKRTVQFAASERLQLLVVGGGRGWYVPIGPKTLCLDLRKLSNVSIDSERSEVTVGGGAKTGETMKICTAAGFYALLPNANSVGVVGAVLGGGANPLNSVHGLTADHIVSIRLVTADGNLTVLKPDSTSKDTSLLQVLGRTGYGFGVISSMTLKVWPISGLGMKEDKVWVRSLVFPANVIDMVAKLYYGLQPLPPRLQSTLIFARAHKPPPEVGPPSIVMSTSFFGPEEEAKEIAASLLTSDVEKHAIVAKTSLTPLQDLNNPSDPMNQPGQYKEMYTCMLKNVTSVSITKVFEEFVRFGTICADAQARSFMVVSSWNPEAASHTASLRGDMTYIRDRGFLIQAGAWYSELSSKPLADAFGTTITRIARETDDGKSIPRMTLANNLYLGQDLKESFSPEMISQYLEMKRKWDPENIFWSPLIDKVHFTM